MNGKTLLILGVTAAATAAGTWFYAKKKYESFAEEEIKNMKEYFEKPNKKEVVNENKKTVTKSSIKNTSEPQIGTILTKYDSGVVKNNHDSQILIISQNEFGELSEYENIGIVLFADGVFCDENYDMIDNMEELIGKEALDMLSSTGDDWYEDALYIRNDKRKVDYEITLDCRTYKEIINDKTYTKLSNIREDTGDE